MPTSSGFSLGGLVGYSLVARHPNVVRRFVAASADYRSREADPDEAPRPMPTDADFQTMRDAYEAGHDAIWNGRR